jgi:nucleoside phosphorylase
MSDVDVLVVTALPEELDAAREAAGGGARWQEHDRDGSAPYLLGEIAASGGGRLTVALARPTRMSGRVTGATTAALAQSLRPACLAMCGVCAGNPDDTVPGDVVVAALAYQYDEGKLRGAEFQGDHQQFPLEDRWLRAAQDYDPAHLPSYGPATEPEATRWLLERILLEQNPRTHPARRRYFPKGTWAPRLARMEKDGLLAREPSGEVALTDEGKATIERIRFDDVDGPEQLPFAVFAGPMASGNAVVQDPDVWPRLKRMGSRKIIAMEMEAATVASLAHQYEVPHWLIAKGVMDGAELDRDADRFKEFAARASAEVLFDLLGRLLEPRAAGRGLRVPAGGPSSPVPGSVKLEITRRLTYDWMDLADIVGVPPFERARFGGDGPRGLWEWLEARGRLGELGAALTAIGRSDLAELLRPYAA